MNPTHAPLPTAGPAHALALACGALQALAQPGAQTGAHAEAHASACTGAEALAGASALRALDALGVAPTLGRSLAEVQAGRARLVRGPHACLLTDVGETTRADLADAALARLCPAAAAFFGTPTPPLLVDLRQAAGGLSHCVHAIAGLGHVVVAGSCGLAELPAALAHELAHVHFRSGNRFLDEGLAVHFETAQVAAHNFPAPAAALPALLDGNPHARPLEHLLRWERQAVLPPGLSGQGGLGGQPAALLTAYAQAWHLIDLWLARLGRLRTLAACRAIGCAPPAALNDRLRQATGLSIDQTEAALLHDLRRRLAEARPAASPVKAAACAVSPPRPPGVPTTAGKTVGAGARMSSDPLAALASRLQAAEQRLQPWLTAPPGTAAGPALPACLAEVDALLQPAFQVALPPPRAWLVRAWRHTVALLHQPGPASMLHLQRARLDFDAAVAAAPDDPQVLQAAGIFFQALSANVGGWPEGARGDLQRAGPGAVQTPADQAPLPFPSPAPGGAARQTPASLAIQATPQVPPLVPPQVPPQVPPHASPLVPPHSPPLVTSRTPGTLPGRPPGGPTLSTTTPTTPP